MAAGELKSVLSRLPAFDHCVVSAALRKDAETEVPSHQQQVGVVPGRRIIPTLLLEVQDSGGVAGRGIVPTPLLEALDRWGCG